MNKEEYRKAVDDVIYLSSCAINGIVPELLRIDEMDLDNVYCFAEFHLLTGITAIALQSAGIRDDRFTQAYAKGIRKNLIMQADMEELLGRLEDAGVWYMPLKGSVLSGLYPELGMRQMADRDILFDGARSDDVREIMESMGFSVEEFGKGAHDVYYKLPVSNFEMHRDLFDPLREPDKYKYYQDVKSRLIKDQDNGYGYHFSDEDAYIYMIAHEYKHYSEGGTGLRSLFDTYVYDAKLGASMNWEYIKGELIRMGIAEFEEKNRSLAMHLLDSKSFENGLLTENALTATDREMLEYIISSGAYGILDNNVQNKVAGFGGGRAGKVRYFFRRLFLPMEIVKSSFPLFYKHKILLPFLPVFRIGRCLLLRRDYIRKELKALKKSK